MTTHTFKAELWLPEKRDTVFSFFADARNLEAIVRRDVERIFAYRQKATLARFCERSVSHPIPSPDRSTQRPPALAEPYLNKQSI
jgi:predicted component of type VI protein secretion system